MLASNIIVLDSEPAAWSLNGVRCVYLLLQFRRLFWTAGFGLFWVCLHVAFSRTLTLEWRSRMQGRDGWEFFFWVFCHIFGRGLSVGGWVWGLSSPPGVGAIEVVGKSLSGGRL